MTLERKGVMRGKNVTFGNFEVMDDFKTDKLGLEWMTLRTPGTDLYSLSESPGYLTLKCSEVAATAKKTPALICRRMQHHKFGVTTKMIFEPKDEKDAAGLLLFKDENHQYFLSVSKSVSGNIVLLQQIGKTGDRILASQAIKAKIKAIELKVISKGTTYDFYYAVEAGKWVLLCKDIDASYLSTAKAGGFTGTTIVMYAIRKY